jgi:hypothetical protein
MAKIAKVAKVAKVAKATRGRCHGNGRRPAQNRSIG